MKRLYKSVLLLLAVCLFCFVLAGCEKESEEKKKIVLTTGFDENEIFRIGEEVCFRPEVMLYLTNMQNQYETVYGQEIWKKKIGDITLEQKIKNMVLARIARIKTMVLLAKERGVTLSTEEEEKASEAASEYFSSLNDTEKQQIGVTLSDVKQSYLEYALANKVYDSIIQDTNPEISDDEARIVTVSQIVIKTYNLDEDGNRVDYSAEAKRSAGEKAQEIKSKLKNGEEFDSLAAKYNEEEQISVSFSKGEKDSVYEEAAFNLGEGEISDVLDTKEGFVILRCDSALDRQQTDENKVRIVKQRKEEAFSQIYNDFLKTQIRKINDDLWGQVQFLHDDQITTSSFFDVFNQYYEETN